MTRDESSRAYRLATLAARICPDLCRQEPRKALIIAERLLSLAETAQDGLQYAYSSAELREAEEDWYKNDPVHRFEDMVKLITRESGLTGRCFFSADTFGPARRPKSKQRKRLRRCARNTSLKKTLARQGSVLQCGSRTINRTKRGRAEQPDDQEAKAFFKLTPVSTAQIGIRQDLPDKRVTRRASRKCSKVIHSPGLANRTR